ncbi:MAG: universal stress protein, partial [Candidatus Eremiobacterota bacterium]
ARGGVAPHGRSGIRRFLLGSVAEHVLRHAPCPVLLTRAGSRLSGDGFRNILVPVDGSRESEQVLPLLSQVATPGGRVILVRATDLGEAPVDPSEREEIQALLRRQLEGLSIPGWTVDYRVEDAPAAEVILYLAEQNPVDLIAMTTHGRAGLSRALLGSVAERVARHAPCPVLAVRIHGQG